jgi:hypothetical protein
MSDFYINRAKKIFEDCPVYSHEKEIDSMYGNEKVKSNYSRGQRQESIIKAMLLIKDFHGSDSPLYRLLDDSFDQIERCPVEKVLHLFVDHLKSFHPDSNRTMRQL